MSESLGYGMPRMSPEATPLYLVIQIFFLDFWACNHHECDPDQLGMCSWVDPSQLSVISETLGYGMPRMSPEATPLYLLIQIFFWTFQHVIIMNVTQTNWECVPESIPATCQSWVSHLVMECLGCHLRHPITFSHTNFFSGLLSMQSSWMWPRPIGYVFLSRSQPPVSHKWVTWLWNA